MGRNRAVARIKLRLERLHSPRLHMTLIVALTGVAGLLSSFVLLHLGIESLWLRYPLVVVLAYAFFLALLWCWLRLKRDDFSDPGLDLPDAGASSGEPATFAQSWGSGGGRGGGGGASGSFDDATLDAPLSPSGLGSSLPDSGVSGSDGLDFPDLDEIIIVAMAIAALLAGALTIAWLVWAAPTLFAELLLDVALAAGLYRRVQRFGSDHWLETAVRRTGWQFLAAAVSLSVAGGLMNLYAPTANSVGQVIQHYRAQR
jgi:hypothetical protein